MLVSKNKTCLSIFFQLLSNASVRLYAAVILIFYKKKNHVNPEFLISCSAVMTT